MKKRVILGALVGTALLLAGSLAFAYQEAPMLRVKVAAGELPAVEERLPVEPLVVEPLEEIGTYGGTFRAARTYACQGLWWMRAYVQGADIFRINESSEPNPGVAKDYKISEDYKQLTFYLREGIKWSDGEPLTAEDFLFAWYDIKLNKELTPGGPGGWEKNIEKVEKIDDYTVRCSVTKPDPNLLMNARRLSAEPAHYLKPYHPDYADPEKLQALVKKEGVEYWSQLDVWVLALLYDVPPKIPSLRPFIVKEVTTDHVIAERNPYYWVVDSEGNQLPYIDEIYMSVVADFEVMQGMILTGEVDFIGPAGESTSENISLYYEYAEESNYRVLMYDGGSVTNVSFMFNQTYEKDLYLGELFSKPEFRQAMSLAINRDEINEMVYFGKADPGQTAPHSSSQYYKEEYKLAYADYQPERANRMLDEVGLKKRDAQGYRLRPDGERLSILLEELRDWASPDVVSILELCQGYWKDVGVEIKIRIGTEEFRARIADNDVQMTSAPLTGGDLQMPWSEYMMMAFVPSQWLPTYAFNVNYGPQWGRWYVTDGKEGKRPPQEIVVLLDAWELSKATFDEEERRKLMDKIFRYQAENLLQIGTVSYSPIPTIVSNRLRNVSEHWVLVAFEAYDYFAEQWFIKE